MNNEQIHDLAEQIGQHMVMSEVLDLEGAARYLKMSTSTLYQKCNAREIPHSKPGKRLCFLRSELKAYIEAHRVPTNQEIKAGSIPA